MHNTCTETLEQETSDLLNAFYHVSSILTIEKFRGVASQDLQVVEQPAKTDILVNDTEVSDVGFVGGLAQQSSQRFNPTVTFLEITNYIGYATDVNKVFKAFRCPTSDNFFRESGSLKRFFKNAKSWLDLSIQ